MAQLIKLKDYISRYEWNIYRYPSQYIRLKQKHWHELYRLWCDADHKAETKASQETTSVFSKWMSFWKKTPNPDKTVTTSEDLFPKTEQELKQYFLDKLFPIQLKWASSTVTDTSFVDQHHYDDDVLKYFLQRFPDTYLVLYYPVFLIQHAPVDGEIILLSPIDIEIIYLLEKDPSVTIVAGDHRVWTMEQKRSTKTFLSPEIALKRTEQISKRILRSHGMNIPIRKTVLSRSNDILFHSEPYQTNIIGRREYANWFREKRVLASPLKNRQLKAAGILLQNCVTSAVKRPEWKEDANAYNMENGGV